MPKRKGTERIEGIEEVKRKLDETRKNLEVQEKRITELEKCLHEVIDDLKFVLEENFKQNESKLDVLSELEASLSSVKKKEGKNGLDA